MLRSTLARLALAAACALPSVAHAVPQGSQPQPAPAAALPGLFDLDFPGGTVEEYLAHVRARSGQPSVVVMSPELNAMPMPPVKVARVSTSGAVRIVEALPSPLNADPPFRIRLSGTGMTLPGEETVWILALEHPAIKQPQPKPVEQPQVIVLPLREFMNIEEGQAPDEERIETILDAIAIGVEMLSAKPASGTSDAEMQKRLQEAGLAPRLVESGERTDAGQMQQRLHQAGLAPAPSQPTSTFEIKLHKRSGLLFLRGTERELMLAHEVIANLGN